MIYVAKYPHVHYYVDDSVVVVDDICDKIIIHKKETAAIKGILKCCGMTPNVKV
jgi:hypothetical protein